MTLLDGGLVAEGQLGTSPSQSIRLSPDRLSSLAAICPRAPAVSDKEMEAGRAPDRGHTFVPGLDGSCTSGSAPGPPRPQSGPNVRGVPTPGRSWPGTIWLCSGGLSKSPPSSAVKGWDPDHLSSEGKPVGENCFKGRDRQRSQTARSPSLSRAPADPLPPEARPGFLQHHVTGGRKSPEECVILEGRQQGQDGTVPSGGAGRSYHLAAPSRQAGRLAPGTSGQAIRWVGPGPRLLESHRLLPCGSGQEAWVSPVSGPAEALTGTGPSAPPPLWTQALAAALRRQPCPGCQSPAALQAAEDGHSPSGMRLPGAGLQLQQLREGVPQGLEVPYHHSGLPPPLCLALLLGQLNGFDF